MELQQVATLETLVLWAGFGAGAVFGAVAQRTGFCTLGAISDIFSMGSWVRMRMWGMAAGVATIGFALLAWLGRIDPADTIYSAARVPWLSALAGGAMFGFGMALASGCGSKALVRIGEGSLKSVVVFVVMGLAAYATMRGLTGVLKRETVDLVAFTIDGGNALPLWLSSAKGVDLRAASVTAGLAAGGSLVAWALADRDFRSTPGALLAGVGIGGAVAFMWWAVGDLGFVAEHPETLDAAYLGTAGGRLQALSFTAPTARALDYVMSFDPGSRPTIEVVSVAGVVAGSLAHALCSRTFRWQGFHGAQDTGAHLVGALFMGVGGITAGGCTVGQGMSGLSTLSVTSAIAVAGIVAGAVVGLRLQAWLIQRA